MNALDFVLIIFLLFGIFKGVMRGFILEAASLVGVILGVYIARAYSGRFSLSMHEWFDLAPKYTVPVAFFVLFVLIILTCHLLAKVLDRTIKINMLKRINQIGGGFLGLIKYAIVLSILVNVFHSIDEKAHMIKQTKKEGSLLYYPIKGLVPDVFPYVEWKDFVKNENN